MSNLKPGDKVKVLDSSYSYYFGKDGLKRTFCLHQGGEYEVVQAGVKMPMWYRVSGKEISRHYDDVSDNDTLIKDSAGKIISIQERFLEKVGKGLAPKFKAGDKVVPVSKSVFSDDCPSWKNGKCRFPFLFVNGIDEEETREWGKTVYTCNWERDGEGDYYTESDLMPYVEPIKELKFKPGDKVVPRGGISGWTFEQWLNCDEPVPEFFKKNGFLYVVDERPNGIIVCSDIQGDKQGDGFLPSDLTPYVEPKPYNNRTVTNEIFLLSEHSIIYSKTIFNGPATICILCYDNKQFKGVAKCNPTDTYNENIGQIIATERASIELSKYRISQAVR